MPPKYRDRVPLIAKLGPRKPVEEVRLEQARKCRALAVKESWNPYRKRAGLPPALRIPRKRASISTRVGAGAGDRASACGGRILNNPALRVSCKLQLKRTSPRNSLRARVRQATGPRTSSAVRGTRVLLCTPGSTPLPKTRCNQARVVSSSSVSAVTDSSVASGALGRKVTILDHTLQTCTQQDKLDYRLERLHVLREGEAIVEITFKEFLAVLLNARQNGRWTAPDPAKFTLSGAADAPDTAEAETQVSYKGKKIDGIFMRRITENYTQNKKICVYGCKSDGLHQWLTGARYLITLLRHANGKKCQIPLCGYKQDQMS